MIVAFTGQPGAGKSTAAEILRNLYPDMGFQIVSFADPVYEILNIVHTGQWNPEWTKNEKKKALPDSYGNETRKLLRAIGEFGRREIHADLWVGLSMQRLEPGRNYIFDDLRFPNELMALQDRGAKIFEVWRPGLEKSEHFSDNALHAYSFPQITNTTFAAVQTRLKQLI